MMDEYKSSYIFQLASECGISSNPYDQEPIEDGTILKFKERYLKWSVSRDKSLQNYLAKNHELFRTYLPNSDRVFNVASQIVWYLDEIIVRDPIVISLDNGNLENLKQNVCHNMYLLSHFRKFIESGYILLAGESIITRMPNELPVAVTSIHSDSNVLQSLKDSVRCSYVDREDSQGNPGYLYEVKLDSGCHIGFYLSEGKVGVERKLLYRLGEKFPAISYDDLKSRIGEDPIEQMDDIFKIEIHRALHAAKIAQDLQSAVIFDRDVDELILKKADAQIDPKKQLATAGVLNLCLPYMQGIPPERLSDMRQELPNAFLDLRSRLYEISKRLLSDSSISPEEIKYLVEKEIIPDLGALDAEMAAVIKKGKILSLGIPIATAVGILTGTLMSAPLSVILGLGVTGAFGTLKSIADKESLKEKFVGRPFYFLWKAKQSS